MMPGEEMDIEERQEITLHNLRRGLAAIGKMQDGVDRIVDTLLADAACSIQNALMMIQTAACRRGALSEAPSKNSSFLNGRGDAAASPQSERLTPVDSDRVS